MVFDVFIPDGREELIDKLHKLSSQLMDSSPIVAFVTGEPGAGKTTLVKEFVKQLEKTNKNLIVTWGQCSSLMNESVSYLVFKEIVSLLSGEGDGSLSDRVISSNNLIRLRNGIATVGELLLKYGPDILGALIPNGVLIGNITKYFSESIGLLDELKKISKPESIDLFKQDLLFEQFCRFLFGFAEKHPLVIVLEDLHWADIGTYNLLFYLIQRLKNQHLKLFIIGTYRPSEINIENGHPLEKLVNETRVIFRDNIINVSTAINLEDGLEFIQAYLRQFPNNFDDSFIAILNEKTKGHPLFFVEMMRYLIENQIISKRNSGIYELVSPIDENQVPGKIEAIFDDRIKKIQNVIRDELFCASVEGEEFTAQVIAKIHDINEKDLLISFSQELERKHEILQHVRTDAVKDSRIDKFKFRHILFQVYLYNKLSSYEKEVLHREVGEILEELYDDEIGTIAPQLARHFSIAKEYSKAVKYYKISGIEAIKEFAYQNAVFALTKALEFHSKLEIKHLGVNEGISLFEVYKNREDAFDVLGDRDAQISDLLMMQNIAKTIKSDELLVEVYYRFSRYYAHISDYENLSKYGELTIQASNRMAKSKFLVYGLYYQAKGLSEQGNFREAKGIILEAIEVAKQIQSLEFIAKTYKILGWVTRYFDNDYHLGIEYLNESLKYFEKIGNQSERGDTLNSLAVAYRDIFEYQKSKECFVQSIEAMRKIGDRRQEGNGLQRLGSLYLFVGANKAAFESFSKAIEIRDEIKDPWGIAHSNRALGRVATILGRYSDAKKFLTLAIENAQSLNSLDILAWTHYYYGLLYEELGNYELAFEHFSNSRELHHLSGWKAREIDSLASEIKYFIHNNDLAKVKNNIQLICSWLENNGTVGLEMPERMYLLLIEGFTYLNAGVEKNFIVKQAIEFIKKVQSSITDRYLRKSYLSKQEVKVILGLQ